MAEKTFTREQIVRQYVNVWGTGALAYIENVVSKLSEPITEKAVWAAFTAQGVSLKKSVSRLAYALAKEKDIFGEIATGGMNFVADKGRRHRNAATVHRVQAEIIRGLWSKYGLYGLILHVRPFPTEGTVQNAVSRVNTAFTGFFESLQKKIVSNIAASFKSKANLSDALVVVEGDWKYATGLKAAGKWPALSKKYKAKKARWLSKTKAKIKKRKERGKALTGLPVGKGRKLAGSADEMGVLTGKMKKALLGIKPRLVTSARGTTLVASVPISQAPYMIPFVRGRKKGKSKQPPRPITLIRKQDLLVIDNVINEAIEHVANFFFGAKIQMTKGEMGKTVIRGLAQVVK